MMDQAEPPVIGERFFGEHAEAGRRVFRGENGGVITRDSAGSTSGWPREDALKLYADLGRLLAIQPQVTTVPLDPMEATMLRSELGKVRCWLTGFHAGRGGNSQVAGEDSLRQAQNIFASLAKAGQANPTGDADGVD